MEYCINKWNILKLHKNKNELINGISCKFYSKMLKIRHIKKVCLIFYEKYVMARRMSDKWEKEKKKKEKIVF